MAQRYLNEALGISEKNKDPKRYFRIYSELAELYEEAGDNQMAKVCVDQVNGHIEWILKETPETAVHLWIVEMHLYENTGEDQKALEKAEHIFELLKQIDTGGNRSRIWEV